MQNQVAKNTPQTNNKSIFRNIILSLAFGLVVSIVINTGLKISFKYCLIIALFAAVSFWIISNYKNKLSSLNGKGDYIFIKLPLSCLFITLTLLAILWMVGLLDNLASIAKTPIVILEIIVIAGIVIYLLYLGSKGNSTIIATGVLCAVTLIVFVALHPKIKNREMQNKKRQNSFRVQQGAYEDNKNTINKIVFIEKEEQKSFQQAQALLQKAEKLKDQGNERELKKVNQEIEQKIKKSAETSWQYKWQKLPNQITVSVKSLDPIFIEAEKWNLEDHFIEPLTEVVIGLRPNNVNKPEYKKGWGQPHNFLYGYTQSWKEDGAPARNNLDNLILLKNKYPKLNYPEDYYVMNQYNNLGKDYQGNNFQTRFGYPLLGSVVFLLTIEIDSEEEVFIVPAVDMEKFPLYFPREKMEYDFATSTQYFSVITTDYPAKIILTFADNDFSDNSGEYIFKLGKMNYDPASISIPWKKDLE